MKIPSDLLRSAMHCQAKGDVRYYLNGIHIKNKLIEATNGHVAVRMTMKESCKKDLIVRIASKIPAKAVDTVLVLDGETIAKHYDNDGDLISLSVIDIIEGEFPDLDKVIKKDINPVSEIGLNASYLALWAAMFKTYPAVRVTFGGAKEAIKITSDSEITNDLYGSPMFIVMPAHLSEPT